MGCVGCGNEYEAIVSSYKQAKVVAQNMIRWNKQIEEVYLMGSYTQKMCEMGANELASYVSINGELLSKR